MKKTLILVAILSLFTLSAVAQQDPERHHQRTNPHDVSKVVKDLSDSQKRKLEAVNNTSRERLEPLRKQQKAVRDSISTLMEQEGDNSKALFPLFDREASLQVQISREMYSTKVQVDRILTKEQRAELKKSMKEGHDKKRKEVRADRMQIKEKNGERRATLQKAKELKAPTE